MGGEVGAGAGASVGEIGLEANQDTESIVATLEEDEEEEGT